ncbi:MAG: outer membrane protein transport protein [Phenylobacterium sp.]|uniref:OmpP1/FadL family transporter n=1 Tax=Phenylobacterium sp. TaxID=1871053 RepID=UPI0027349705|nr:outer membrane protein transport protein [Phenylobacterium sp.]MDP1643193.1 outer membrane protein transport protein [Phenylobacterium sp.]MDP3116982.1 outer membrane protein transport protein [Phenylobacterium sp.]MDP3383688.1 outer membrane protein transport protein [Phenylobacterium sp.]
MKKALVLALAGATSLTAVPALAGGFYLQEQSVRGAGRAFTGEVADTGVSSLWWNPAAIARSPREVYVGAHAVFVDAQVVNDGSTITYPGGVTVPVQGEPRAFNPIQNGVIPNFAIATPVGDRFALGLSVAAPYNFTTEYRDNAWARYDGLESGLTTADMQLTGAMQVTDWLDLGAGVSAQYTEATLSTAYPNLAPGAPDGVSQLKGNGWDFGWTVGAQARFNALTFGASYRSAIEHDLEGDVRVVGLAGPLAPFNTDTAGSAAFSTPWIATFGARWQATERLALNAQVNRIGWSEFDAIEVTSASVNQTLPQRYKDVTSGGVGVDYIVNPALTLRAGAQFDPTPTPDDLRTARVPDGDRWLYGVGATARLTDSLQMDAALAYISFDESRINHDTTFYEGTPAQTVTRLRGDVNGEGAILSLGLRKTF